MTFSFFIYALILLLVFFIMRVCSQTIKLIKVGDCVLINLKKHLIDLEKKHQNNTERILLTTNLEQTLFNRFFEINKQLILLQKFFLNNI